LQSSEFVRTFAKLEKGVGGIPLTRGLSNRSPC